MPRIAASLSHKGKLNNKHRSPENKLSDSTLSLQKSNTLNVELNMHGHEHDNVLLVSMHVQFNIERVALLQGNC